MDVTKLLRERARALSVRAMPAAEAGGAWSVLKTHGKALHAVLRAWDDDRTERVTRPGFLRAARALGALQICARIPSDVELDSMFDLMAAGKETLGLAELLKQPLDPHAFEPVDDQPVDPDDCFECFGQTCMACNAKPAEGRKLLACLKCKRVRYCSRACQLTGWRQGHKESCGKRPLPTPSKVATGSAQQVLPILSEFHSAHSGLAFACLSRLGGMALDPDQCEKHLRVIVDWPAGVDAIIKTLRCYAGAREIALPGFMLICAICQSGREGAAAVVQAGGLEPLIDLFKVSVKEPHLLRSGLTAMRCMAATGPTAKQQLVDSQGVFGVVWAMREHQDDVPLLLEAVGALSNIAYRGGVDIRKYVIWNSGVEAVCTVMRKHVDAPGKHEQLASASVTALRMFIAGDESGLIAGSAAEVAHAMTATMTKFLGVEAVVDAMMYHQQKESIQEDGAAVIANIASVDLGAKRQHEVAHGSELADTQATRNLVDSLVPICKAIKRFPRLGSPRHALHVLVANLGSPKEALEAGAEKEWLPLALQYEKGEAEKL